MRLKDLVHRSALRTRSAGDSEVGLPTGMDYQVFEVTNLTIPEGTDLSGVNFHPIGAVPLDVGQVAVVSFEMSVAEALDPADSLLFGVELNALVGGSGGGNGASLGPLGNVSDTVVADSGVVFRAVNSGNDPASPIIYFATAGPTTTDITVVKARAAFLIL